MVRTRKRGRAEDDETKDGHAASASADSTMTNGDAAPAAAAKGGARKRQRKTLSKQKDHTKEEEEEVMAQPAVIDEAYEAALADEKLFGEELASERIQFPFTSALSSSSQRGIFSISKDFESKFDDMMVWCRAEQEKLRVYSATPQDQRGALDLPFDCDIVIEAGPTSRDGTHAYGFLVAHKFIIKTACEFFRVMLSGPWLEGAGGSNSNGPFVIQMPNVTFPAMEVVLRFLYSGTVGNLRRRDIVASIRAASLLDLKPLLHILDTIIASHAHNVGNTAKYLLSLDNSLQVIEHLIYFEDLRHTLGLCVDRLGGSSSLFAQAYKLLKHNKSSIRNAADRQVTETEEKNTIEQLRQVSDAVFLQYLRDLNDSYLEEPELCAVLIFWAKTRLGIERKATSDLSPTEQPKLREMIKDHLMHVRLALLPLDFVFEELESPCLIDRSLLVDVYKSINLQSQEQDFTPVKYIPKDVREPRSRVVIPKFNLGELVAKKELWSNVFVSLKTAWRVRLTLDSEKNVQAWLFTDEALEEQPMSVECTFNALHHESRTNATQCHFTHKFYLGGFGKKLGSLQQLEVLQNTDKDVFIRVKLDEVTEDDD